MNIRLQIIMVIASALFLGFVVIMIKNKKIELKYTLTWLLTAAAFIVLSIFPETLVLLSQLLNIKEPVNTLFLSIIFFMLLIIFTLTLALSRNASRVKTITQEIGIIKMELSRLEKDRP
jgi:hypothetical protein